MHAEHIFMTSVVMCVHFSCSYRSHPHMYVLTALVIVLLHSWAASADGCLCNDSVCLYEPIRSQLTSTPNADSLFLGFFTTVPFYGSVQIISAVNLTVHGQLQDIMDGAKPYNNETMWMYLWYPYRLLRPACSVSCFRLSSEERWTHGQLSR